MKVSTIVATSSVVGLAALYTMVGNNGGVLFNTPSQNKIDRELIKTEKAVEAAMKTPLSYDDAVMFSVIKLKHLQVVQGLYDINWNDEQLVSTWIENYENKLKYKERRRNEFDLTSN